MAHAIKLSGSHNVQFNSKTHQLKHKNKGYIIKGHAGQIKIPKEFHKPLREWKHPHTIKKGIITPNNKKLYKKKENNLKYAHKILQKKEHRKVKNHKFSHKPIAVLEGKLIPKWHKDHNNLINNLKKNEFISFPWNP